MTEVYQDVQPWDINLQYMRWGRFSVCSEAEEDNAADAREIAFVQTSISLSDPDSEKLIKQLAPVRESVLPELLSFESLIQRDLDDERVSSNLIPYLCARDKFRMFPSILVLLLPSRNESLCQRYMQRHTSPDRPEGDRYTRQTITYGDGDRLLAFEFSRLRNSRQAFLPFGAQLKINSDLCKLAIIDGQHRAMALLALHRNKTSWPERARAFKDFYANHTKERLDALDLSGISLPVTLCFFPWLYEGSPAKDADKLTTLKAARRLFLDVNRNAKTPSRARQVLLDDSRLTSDFVRALMGRIKDEPKPSGLQLFNLYYDQMEDGDAHLPRLAVTSVLHIQYALRALLLGKKPQSGERLSTRCDFGKYNPGEQENNRTLVEMLCLPDHFGDDATRWKDSTVPAEYRAAATEVFLRTWGRGIDEFLENFPPFKAIVHGSRVVLQQLDQAADEDSSIVRKMLFEGQGLRIVHDAVRKRLTQEVADLRELDSGDAPAVPPYPATARTAFARQGEKLKLAEENAMRLAAEHFWGDGDSWPTWMTDEQKGELTKEFNELCSHLFKTKAFLVGFAMTLAHIERKLDETERADFWRLHGDSLVVQRLCSYFRHSAGFPGPGCQQDRQREWVVSTPRDARFSGLKGNGYYGFIRQTFNAALQDGLWQIPKYWFIEILACENLKDLRDADSAWQTAATARGASDVDAIQLAKKIAAIANDAARIYRERLLRAHFEAAVERWRRDNVGLELSQNNREAIWRDSCDVLAKQLERAFDTTSAELRAIRDLSAPKETINTSDPESEPEPDDEVDTDAE